jgi:penicillin G amidase
MKTLKRILAAILVLLLLVIIIGFFLVRNVSRKALPDYNQNIELTGLTGEVVVYRDIHAVPHIYAENEHDLYLAVGYVMAQDRLWQMDFLRRVGMGRLSEIFGEVMVDNDHFLRALRIPEKSEMVLAQLDEDILKALEAFREGVNQYIEKHQNKLPPEFTILGYKPEPWELTHSVNLIGYMAWDLTGSYHPEIFLHKVRNILDEEKFLELVPELAHHKTYVHPDLSAEKPSDLFSLLDKASNLRNLGIEIFSGSNNWAVSGGKSATGKPILANDMHLSFGSPGIWYQMHHVIEGKLNVTGVVLPGAPQVVVGHNERIAWGMTNVYVDEMDFYLETVDPGNPDFYLYNGEWKKMIVSEEKIAVKGGDTVTKEIRFTHRGPIVSSFKKIEDQAISMQWTGNLLSNELRTIHLLNRAANWEDFRDAASTMISVSQNIIYADVDGNIGMQTATGAPIRKDGNAIFIYPGETDQYDWYGLLPFEKLPYTFNPAQGHISSANNRTTDNDYSYYIGYWYARPHRAERIIEMLNEKEKLGVEDYKKMMVDHKSKHVEIYLGDLVDVLSNASSLSTNEQAAFENLKNWDMVLTSNSIATTVFEKFYLKFLKNIALDELGEDLYNEFLGTGDLNKNFFDHIWRNRESSWINNVNTTEEETFEDMILLSFRETIEWLEQNHGNNPAKWEWGKIHQLTVAHPMGTVKILDLIFGLNRGPFAVGGSFHTVSPYSYSFRNPFAATSGASQRHIFDLSNWDNSLVIIPTGTSGIPASKYYLDQTEMYINNQYKKDAFSEREVISNARYVTKFLPAGDK